MRIVAATFLALLCSVPADAALFTWTVQGTISSVPLVHPSTPLDGLFAVGQPFTWTITMDSSVPDTDPNPHCGMYQPYQSLKFVSGSLNLSVTKPPAGNLSGVARVQSAAFGGPDVCGLPPFANSGYHLGFLGDLRIDWQFFKSAPTDMLFVDPSGINTFGFDLAYSGGNIPVATGRVTSVTAVPEPMTPALLALGVVAARRRFQRERRPRVISTRR